MKKAAMVVASVFGALAVCLVLFVLLFDFRGLIESQLSAAAGRDVKVHGAIDLDLGSPTQITLGDVRLANPAPDNEQAMARLGSGSVAVDPWALLRGRVHVRELRLEGARASLFKPRQGQANWAGLGGEAKSEEEGGAPPAIDRIVVDDGLIVYEDEPRKARVEVRVQTIPADGPQGEERVRITAQGTLGGIPLTGEAEVGAFTALLGSAAKYPTRGRLEAGATSIAFDGALVNPLEFEGLDGTLTAAGDNLQDLFPLFGVSTPNTPPYRISGQVHHEAGIWQISEADGKVGDSDIRGSFRYETGGERPLLKADLASRRLDFDDLGVLVGAPSQTGKGETANAVQKELAQRYSAEERVLPDAKLDFARVRTMDAEVTFRGEQVNAPDLPLDNVRLTMRMRDGLIEFEPLELGVAGGTLSSAIAIDGRKDPVASYLNLWLRGFSLERIAGGKAARGNIYGRVQLQTVGNSIRESFGTANGEASFIIEQGAARELLVEAAGLDIAETLTLALGDDSEETPISCGLATFDVRSGVLQSRAILFDTEESVLTGNGTIDLGKEALSLDLLAHPKEPSLLTVDSPVRLTGSFKAVKLSLAEPQRALAQTGIAAVLGAVATPLAAALAFVSPGGQEDAPCNTMVERLRARKAG